LFYGARPAWRTLSGLVLPGPDVAQLDRNLIALGFGRYLTVGDYYTAATGYAVELWQQAAGLPVTGTVPLGQVVFAPDALRVTSVAPGLGSPPQPGGQVLTATSTAPVVTAQLPVSQEYLVRRGQQVTVTLPDGATITPGTVAAVSSVATASQSGGQDSSGQQGAGGGSQESVALTVRLNRPLAAGNFDQAPVSVSIVSAHASNVLAVPVSALVALAGGGYAVEVVRGTGTAATRQLVAVRTGLFSSTLVQVSGAGIAVGQRVEVPAQ
jgi:peptidoglycan hydrolase-like protein with peptidoglycan-binding domain